MEFECLPTPRLTKNGSFEEKYLSKNNSIKLKHFIENRERTDKIEALVKSDKLIVEKSVYINDREMKICPI